MSGLFRKIVLFVLLQLLGAPAFAQTVTVGATDFPLGENAFPNVSQCLDPTGCGSEDYRLVDFTDPLLRPVSITRALLGHRLDFVAIDLDSLDAIHLVFPAPIANQNGADVYVAQAAFQAALKDANGLNEVQIRFGSSDWHTIPQSQFVRDAGVLPTIFYQDPEIKSDAYQLWFATLDLSDFGFAADQTIGEVTIRGVVNASHSGLDAAIVGNLNSSPSGNQPPELRKT